MPAAPVQLHRRLRVDAGGVPAAGSSRPGERGLRLLGPDEACRALLEPEAFERWSVVTGDPILAVDLRGAGGFAFPAEARASLDALPAVFVARVAAGEDAVAAEGADVVVASDDRLTELDAKVRAHPQASVALAQLLRRTLQLDIAGSLWAESLVYGTLQAGPEFGAWLEGRERRTRPAIGGSAVGMRRAGDCLEIRFQRPEKRNAFSAEMRDGLCEALAFLLSEEEIAQATLCGEGPGFCSGGDLDEFGTFPDPATAHAIRMTRSPALLLSRCHGRVTARVHGACIGAGMELPAFCHRTLATEDATFAIPEVGMGLVPGAGGTASLPRRIGRQACAWLGITGRRIDAAEALAIGLVDEVVAEHSGP